MLSSHLASAIRDRYPNSIGPAAPSQPEHPIAVFPALHPAVGDVSVWVEDGEVRIEVGTHTHGHFATYDAPSPEATMADTILAALRFLDDLFENRIVIWSAGRSGGWYPVDTVAIGVLGPPKSAKRYLWSGPIALKE